MPWGLFLKEEAMTLLAINELYHRATKKKFHCKEQQPIHSGSWGPIN